MSTIGDLWQALPPRKKSRRGTGSTDSAPASTSAATPSLPSESSSSSSSAPSSSSGGSSAPAPSSSTTDQITANIARRTEARSKHIEGTLEHKDGCAGEFYEYLDHTADVQCHAWGATLQDALANMAPCMFNYMTDLSMVQEDPSLTTQFTVTGHDLHTLLFAYMDEMLFRFSTDLFCVCRVEILDLQRAASAADTNHSMTVRAHGAKFDREKHVQGTEIKAITYSNMQVHEAGGSGGGVVGGDVGEGGGEGRCDIYVIVDI